MPRVQLSRGPEVQRTALQPVYQGTPDVSSGLRSAARGLDAAANVVDRRQTELIDIETSEADTEIGGAWLQWDATNKKNYVGNKSAEYETAAAEWWDKAREDYSQRLSPAARQRLGVTLQKRRAAALGAVAQHAAAERARHADATDEADAAMTAQFAASTGASESGREDLLKIAARKGERNGWDTVQVQAQFRQWVAPLHLLAITRMAEGDDVTRADPDAAQAYYATHKDEIPLAVQERVQKVIAGEKTSQEAKAFAARVADLPETEQLRQARDLSGDIRDKAVAEVRINVALKKAEEAERNKAYVEDAWDNYVYKGKRPPTRLLEQMTAGDRRQIESELVARAERARAQAEGKTQRTDPDTWVALLDMRRVEPEKFASLPLGPYAGKLSTSDLAAVSNLQAAMNKPDAEKDTATAIQQMSTYTRGYKPERRAEFERTALSELERFRVENKKPMGMKEREALFDRLAFESTSWFSKEKFFQVPPNEQAAWVKNNVPAEDRRAIEKLLKSNGVPATPEVVLDWYIEAERRRGNR